MAAHWQDFLPSFPALQWGRNYNRDTFWRDLLAAVIVTVMLIPQSLAYALLAGLPPQAGLYASVAPLLLYALLGSSRVLAVGPVAVVSLMTAAAVGNHADPGSPHYWMVAITLAWMSGCILLLMGVLRLGFLANFLSHPVISGFISASGVLIATSQLKTIMGVNVAGDNFILLVWGLAKNVSATNQLSFFIGSGCIAFLIWVRHGLKPLLVGAGFGQAKADILTKAGPVVAIALTTGLCWTFQWQDQGLKVVGHVPAGLPPIRWPLWDAALWKALAMPALLISVVGFVESVSVGQTLAAKRRQRIEPDQELLALGASNIVAGLSCGLPVTGGFARSVVNFDAGAQTPAAGIFTALGITLATLWLTPALYYLPQATLAATIVVAVISLVDLGVLRRTWAYSKADFAAALSTLLVTLAAGVEIGLTAGVGLSLALYMLRTSRPHIAQVGLIEGTEHYRNVDRHSVITHSHVLGLRVDENLYFANCRVLEDRINQEVASRPSLKHLVLQCSAINHIDASALESLESIAARLHEGGIALHLSEVKGPVMDRLRETHFLHSLPGMVYMSQFQAMEDLLKRA